MPIFLDSENVIGSIVIELGCVETCALWWCRGQDQRDLSDLPAQDGCTLCQLLTDPNSVNLENLTVDMFGVSYEIRSAVKVMWLPKVFWDVMLCCLQHFIRLIDLSARIRERGPSRRRPDDTVVSQTEHLNPQLHYY